MKSFHIDCELAYDVSQQTVFLINVGVPDTPYQRVLAETTTISGGLDAEPLEARETGNRILRIDVPPGPFSLRYLANVTVERPENDRHAVEVAHGDLAQDVAAYLTPSRYSDSDELFGLAASQFGDLPPGYGRVEAICRWLRANLSLSDAREPGLLTAQEAINARIGTSRDFAHVGIAICRALGIPARFVSGYARHAHTPSELHAVFEAYLSGSWLLFDPVEAATPSEFVRIGVGQDASEAPFATLFGEARFNRLTALIEAATPVQAPNVLIEIRDAEGIAVAAA